MFKKERFLCRNNMAAETERWLCSFRLGSQSEALYSTPFFRSNASLWQEEIISLKVWHQPSIEGCIKCTPYRMPAKHIRGTYTQPDNEETAPESKERAMQIQLTKPARGHSSLGFQERHERAITQCRYICQAVSSSNFHFNALQFISAWLPRECLDSEVPADFH